MRNNIILYILIQLIGIYLPIEYKIRSQLWSRIVLILNVLYKNTTKIFSFLLIVEK